MPPAFWTAGNNSKLSIFEMGIIYSTSSKEPLHNKPRPIKINGYKNILPVCDYGNSFAEPLDAGGRL